MLAESAKGQHQLSTPRVGAPLRRGNSLGVLTAIPNARPMGMMQEGSGPGSLGALDALMTEEEKKAKAAAEEAAALEAQGKEAADAAAQAHKDKDKNTDQDPPKLLDLHLKNTLVSQQIESGTVPVRLMFVYSLQLIGSKPNARFSLWCPD